MLAAGILISILILTGLSNVFAKQLIDCSSYDDGGKEGTQQGETDLQDSSSFNPACDPNGLHTSDGLRTNLHPMIKITSPANNATVPHGNIPVQGTASDNLGTGSIRNVLVHIDSGATVLPYTMASPSSPGNWSKWSTTLNIPTTGTERIQARVTDNAGNQNWNSVTVTVT